MDVYESQGRRFEMVMASDVIRDGVGLELTELSAGQDPGPVLEVFWHDDGSGFDFLSHRSGNLPFDVVERFVAEARRSLPPSECDFRGSRHVRKRTGRSFEPVPTTPAH
ncbi:hypothetical protein V6K52_16260 [Knoellia sp. S7-12]|uniref:hypothetical protein n=1 Tax=Knoellia sp. S7-12 TaxID=3126698 RepID=UPI003366AD26